jgi:hypothetical protein
MEVRDAVEDDADALAALADLPEPAVAQLVHDRTVRVAGTDDGTESDDDDIRGFVAFDAARDTVHVTQLAGDTDAVSRLLDEPARFAEREGMPVEVLVPESESSVVAAVEDYGFEETGTGPRFEGEATRRYRLEA